MSNQELLELIRLPSNMYRRDTILLLSILDDFEAINKRLKNEERQIPSNMHRRDTILLLSILDDFTASNKRLKNEERQNKAARMLRS